MKPLNIKPQRGFSILEVLVSVAIFSFILLVIMSFIFWARSSNTKTKADSDVLENARRILDTITYEIKGATGIYTPTSASHQLSLETSRYLPTDETTTFIDFFLCGSNICLKKESQNPIPLNSDSVQIGDLTFSLVANGANSSVKISVTVDYKNPTNQISSGASVTLESTVALRNYQ